MIARLLLVLALCAGGADARTTNLRRLDGKSAKVGKSVTTTTSTVAASTTTATATKSSKSEGSKSSKSLTTTTTTTTSTAPPGVTLTITPAGLTDGRVDEEYTFDFTANNIPAGVENVIFEWTFSTGAGGTGSATEAVSGGSASTQQSNTYDLDGTWALIVVLKDESNGEELATETVIVQIGDPVVRPPQDLDCDVWTTSLAGSQGTTIDTWTLSRAIPDDTPIDFRFNTVGIPDRFFVEYPPSTLVLDTGWRGDSSFNGSPLYPGGIAGGPIGEELDIARRITGQDEVKVTVVGPDPSTAWEYQIRANCNPSSNIASIESDWTADTPKEPIGEDIVNIEGAATVEIAEMAAGSKSSKAHSFSMSLPSKSGKGSKGSKAHSFSLSVPSKSGKGEAI